MKNFYTRIITASLLIPLALLFIFSSNIFVSFIFYFFYSSVLAIEIMMLLPHKSKLQQQAKQRNTWILLIFLWIYTFLQISQQVYPQFFLLNKLPGITAPNFLGSFTFILVFFVFVAMLPATLGKSHKLEKKETEENWFSFQLQLLYHSSFCFLMVSFAAFSLVRLKHVPLNGTANYPLAAGQTYLLLAIATAVLYDSFAYIFGKLFGKKKIGLIVSQKKTYAGLIGGCFSTVTILLLVRFLLLNSNTELAILINTLPLVHSYMGFALLTLTLCLIAQIGDLLASLIKRVGKAKDSGKILPGHGGIYDRTDALLLVAAILCELVYVFV